MIKKLNNSDIEISRKIHSVFQNSYKIEAELLNVADFPPLKRTLNDYKNSETEFYGYWKNEEISAIIELERIEQTTEIHSLVVEPNFFRQGLAKKLMTYILQEFDSNVFYVETGLKNKPAIQLYQKFTFI